MLEFLIYIICFYLLIYITRPITVLVHELGHAIMGILLTKKTTTIYLGSYGYSKDCKLISIGKLKIIYNKDIFKWNKGLADSSIYEISIYKEILIILAGPLLPILLFSLGSYLTFTFDLHGSIKLIMIVLVASALFDLFYNLKPNSKSIQLFNGKISYNDGYQIFQFIKFRNQLKFLNQAIKFLNKNEFENANKILLPLIESDKKNELAYRLTLYSLIYSNKFETAKSVWTKFISFGKIISEDYLYASIIYLNLKEYSQSIEFADLSLELNPMNTNSLNNKGYALQLLKQYEASIPLFDKVIEIDDKYAYAYNNRGLSKIKIGNLEEGLKDINYAIELDENNSFAFRNLGIYHHSKGDLETALELYKKAKEINNETENIDELIENVTLN